MRFITNFAVQKLPHVDGSNYIFDCKGSKNYHLQQEKLPFMGVFYAILISYNKF